jgi:hypothetical protein
VDDKTYAIVVDILKTNSENNQVITNAAKRIDKINERFWIIALVIPIATVICSSATLIYFIWCYFNCKF